MSLNFDLRDVRKRLGDERWNELTTSPDTRDMPEDNQKWHPVTDAIIWFSMVVDLGSITEKNLDEWAFRLGLVHMLSGPDHYDVGGGIGRFRVNRVDLVNHIGLRTNVTTKTRAQFLAKIFGQGSADEKKAMLPASPDLVSAAEQVNTAWTEHVAKEAANN